MPRLSNATASTFEWEFQRNTVIVLTLKNIESASKVKIEGEDGDVEITFSNGKVLIAQAKAIGNPDDASFVIGKADKNILELQDRLLSF